MYSGFLQKKSGHGRTLVLFEVERPLNRFEFPALTRCKQKYETAVIYVNKEEENASFLAKDSSKSGIVFLISVCRTVNS